MNWRVGRVARAVAPWTIALIVSTASSAAFAGAPSPEDRSTARELALEGHNALKAGDYALAVDRFTRAPSESRRIAEAGYRRFLAHHTAAHRMAEFSRILTELV